MTNDQKPRTMKEQLEAEIADMERDPATTRRNTREPTGGN
jgi:hypothetical protein